MIEEHYKLPRVLEDPSHPGSRPIFNEKEEFDSDVKTALESINKILTDDYGFKCVGILTRNCLKKVGFLLSKSNPTCAIVFEKYEGDLKGILHIAPKGITLTTIILSRQEEDRLRIIRKELSKIGKIENLNISIDHIPNPLRDYEVIYRLQEQPNLKVVQQFIDYVKSFSKKFHLLCPQ